MPKRAPRVVVLDDEPAVTGLVVDVLRAAGFEAWGTTGAVEAFRKIEEVEEVAPDAVVTDLDMPGLDGVEFTAALRSRPATRHIKVVFLSGMTSQEDYAIAHFAGAAAYVGKPFDAKHLIDALERVLPSETAP